MDNDVSKSSENLVKRCNCGGSCSAETWLRSVKRKYDELEGGGRLIFPENDCMSSGRVQVNNECDVLREMVSSQHQSIQGLYAELEEERSASASAANEAMALILRLQREMSDVLMEARQFKCFAEDKMVHDHQEILTLEDELYKREEMIHSLTCEVQAYKHRLMGYGLTEAEVESLGVSSESSIKYLDSQLDPANYKYPPLICDANETHGPLEEGDGDFAACETPRNREDLKNLESRISQIERSPSHCQLDGDVSTMQNVVEKIIVSHSPKKTSDSRKVSSNRSGSLVIKDLGPDLMHSPRHRNSRDTDFVSQIEENSRRVDISPEAGYDSSDRIYTIDSVHNGASLDSNAEPKTGVGAHEEVVSAPNESLKYAGISDPDINKLYLRLQALEAERESMRQVLLSVRTDKVQLMLLKEIAQRLCNEGSPEHMSSKKAPVIRSFSFMSACKWMVSLVFWRKKSHQDKCAPELSAADEGLQFILDKCPRMRQWRCHTSTQLQESILHILASKVIA